MSTNQSLKKGIILYSVKARLLNPEELDLSQETIRRKYQFNPKALKSLDVLNLEDDGIVTGSNIFVITELSSQGIQIAQPKDLDYIAKNHPDSLRDRYEYLPRLVLRSEGDSYEPNDPLAKALAKEIKGRKNGEKAIKYMTEKGIPILIKGFTIKQNNNSKYGLTFTLEDKGEFLEAPHLAHINNNKKFSELDEEGSPIFDEKGTRNLFTRKNGLSRLNLDSYLDLVSCERGLADSSSGGRVVVVSNEAASQN